MWLERGRLDKIYDKKMPSTGAQILLGGIQISQNRYRAVFETKYFAKSDSVEKLYRIEKGKFCSSKGKKNGKEVVEQSLLRLIALKMMEPKVCLVCIKLDFAISFTGFFEDFGI